MKRLSQIASPFSNPEKSDHLGELEDVCSDGGTQEIGTSIICASYYDAHESDGSEESSYSDDETCDDRDYSLCESIGTEVDTDDSCLSDEGDDDDEAEGEPTTAQIKTICNALAQVASQQQFAPGQKVEIETVNEVTGRSSRWSIHARPSGVGPTKNRRESVLSMRASAMAFTGRKQSMMASQPIMPTCIKSELIRPLTEPEHRDSFVDVDKDSPDGIVTAKDVRRSQSKPAQQAPRFSDMVRQSLIGQKMSPAEGVRGSVSRNRDSTASQRTPSLKPYALKIINARRSGQGVPTIQFLMDGSQDELSVSKPDVNNSDMGKRRLSNCSARSNKSLRYGNTTEEYANSEFVPYNYRRLSRVSCKSNKLKGAVSRKSNVDRVASDPEIGGDQAACILLPDISLGDLFSKPQATAVDTIGGIAPPVLSFTFNPKLCPMAACNSDISNLSRKSSDTSGVDFVIKKMRGSSHKFKTTAKAAQLAVTLGGKDYTRGSKSSLRQSASSLRGSRTSIRNSKAGAQRHSNSGRHSKNRHSRASRSRLSRHTSRTSASGHRISSASSRLSCASSRLSEAGSGDWSMSEASSHLAAIKKRNKGIVVFVICCSFLILHGLLLWVRIIPTQQQSLTTASYALAWGAFILLALIVYVNREHIQGWFAEQFTDLQFNALKYSGRKTIEGATTRGLKITTSTISQGSNYSTRREKVRKKKPIRGSKVGSHHVRSNSQ